MTVQTQDQGIQKYARIAKTTLHIGFTVAAVVIAATTIYAAATGMALSSTFLAYLANPWAIAIIAFVAAAYLLIGAYQQLYSMEGAKGQDGKDADLAALDTIKSGTISFIEEGEGENKVQKLYLKFSKDDYNALVANADVGTDVTLYVLLPGKKEAVKVKFKHEAASKPEDKERTVTLTHVGDLTIADKMKEARETLGMETTNSKNVAVSNQDLKAIPTNLVGVIADSVAKQVAV